MMPLVLYRVGEFLFTLVLVRCINLLPKVENPVEYFSVENLTSPSSKR